MHKQIMIAWKIMLPGLLLFLGGCSTGEVFLDTRVTEGFIGPRKINVYVAEIAGADQNNFRQELYAKLSRDSNVVLQPYGTVPDSTHDTLSNMQGIIIAGTHDVRHNDQTVFGVQEEGGSSHTETEQTDEFQYRIMDAASLDELTSGTIAHSDVTRYDDSHASFWGTVFGSIFHTLTDPIVSPDAGRRRQTIDEFVWSIMIHTETRTVVLYFDTALPELKAGIDSARLGAWDKAVEMFQAAAENHPKHRDGYKAYYNLGMAYERTNEFEKAITSFSLAYELHPDSRSASEIDYCEQYSRRFEWRENSEQ